jgi:hypothetical protein
MVAATTAQLAQWPHLAGDTHAADRECLLVMAEGIDAARESVAEGSAALPLVNACRYLLEVIRKMAPEQTPDDGFDAAMQWDD